MGHLRVIYTIYLVQIRLNLSLNYRRINSLDNHDSAALATIVADSLIENETNSDLRHLESRIAAHRFEPP